MSVRSAIEEIELFSRALPGSKTKILSYAQIKKYKRGQFLFQTRDRVEHIYVMISGYTILERINRNDNRKAIFLLDKGKIINEVVLERPKSAVSCYALTEVEILSIPTLRFLEIMESDFGFTKLVIDSMANKIKRLYHQVENTTKMMKLDRQVASRIWKLGRDFGIRRNGETELPFPLTITLLAELVGSNRESVSRVVRNLSRENVITIDRGVCKIHDPEKLNKILEIT